MRPLLLPFLLAALVTFAGCDVAFEAPFACTEEFRTVNVEVVDAFGRALPGLSYTSVHERTGDVLVTGGPDTSADARGLYPVATDADAPLLRVDGDPVVFTASGEGILASARYVLSDDGCHIRKEDGPDQIVAEPI